jgi:hypothetical protein
MQICARVAANDPSLTVIDFTKNFSFDMKSGVHTKSLCEGTRIPARAWTPRLAA